MPPSPPPWRLSLIFGLGGVITPKWIPMTPQLPQGRKFCIQMSHTKEISLVLSSSSIVIQPPRSYPPNSYHAILAALYVRSCSRLLCGEHDWHSSHCIARAATRGIWQSRGATGSFIHVVVHRGHPFITFAKFSGLWTRVVTTPSIFESNCLPLPESELI